MHTSATGFCMVLIGFVLPWFSIGCGGIVKNYSGIMLVQEGGACLLLILPTLIALTGLLAVFKLLGEKSNKIWRASALLSPLLFIVAFSAVLGDIASSSRSSLSEVVSSLLNDMVKNPNETYGLWITFIGYAILYPGAMKTVDDD